MTEIHAENLSKRLAEFITRFERAKTKNNWAYAEEVWREVCCQIDVVIREARASKAEAETLAVELSTYRPTRFSELAAPRISDHLYVFTAKSPWVCAAIELRETLWVDAGLGGGYLMEHSTTERKTVCGKTVTYPVRERFTSGGWPRLRELCPDCTRLLSICPETESLPYAQVPG